MNLLARLLGTGRSAPLEPRRLTEDERREAIEQLTIAKEALFRVGTSHACQGLRTAARKEDGHTTVVCAWADVVYLLEALNEGAGVRVEGMGKS